MARFPLILPVRPPVCAIGLAIALSAIVINIGRAGTTQPYSDIASGMVPGLGPTGLITLSGQNGAQQAMAGSINKVCPNITGVATGMDPPTQGQVDLATICQAMTLNALQVQGHDNPLKFTTSFGLNASQLNGALEQLNGGAEVLIPTS
ncbi:MAG: hypothetical protein JO212_00970, partial [Acetobacteraceae bacterium]|nr:hypothetical protein [Acetobacteraceae bacterium]